MALFSRSLTTLSLVSLLFTTTFISAQDSQPTPSPTSAQTTKEKGKKKGDSDVAATTPPASKPDQKKQSDKKAAEKNKTEEPKKPADPFSEGTFAGLKLRNIGPAIFSGRVIAFAVDPNDKSTYYVASASGGVWKTTNAGTTYDPIFDDQGSFSIGAIALDPKDPNVVWVGTGELNSQRSVSYGDGLYKSEDGGKSWKKVGLEKSEHIARIVIDPRDSNVVYVAAQGPLWGPGGDRGLYKTTDGGKTWKNVLIISENTGVTDVAQDPSNPDVLYAAAYQRQRRVWTLIDGGPESALYKSTDAGATWNKLKNGLPSVDMGRIGIAISPVDNNVVYATVEAAEGKGGIFRSRDRGASWEKRNPYDNTAMYYAQIVADPKNVDRIYEMGFAIMVSDDGGKTLKPLPTKSKHVDNHAIWIDPDNTRHYLVGCDGGVYESWDRAETWNYKANLPLAQMYDVAVDNSEPFYYVYGGTQDNQSMGGPARTRSASGIINTDWFMTAGGDGFRSQVDPADPNTVYAESQNGGLIRFDRATGNFVGVQPQDPKDGPPNRWNWDSPIYVSFHQHTRLYFAANRIYRSDDRGDTWRFISPDLSRQIDRNTLPVMGKVWGPDAVAKNASTEFYGNIVAFAESPKDENLLYAGSDDGLIHVTHDGGGSWTKFDHFIGVPDNSYVSRLIASRFDVNTVYAAFDNHKNSDFKPYLLKSTDAGKTWASLVANLPERGQVMAIAEDSIDRNLLFVGTEFGVFFSSNGGAKWIKLTGDMPTTSIHDAVIQQREGDLALASFGRGFYVLDDISPLRGMSAEKVGKPALLFPPRRTMLYLPSFLLGGDGKATQGESFYTAPNPPYGVTFTYYLKEKSKSLKEQRQAAEKDAEKNKQSFKYPSNDELRTEAEESAPQVFLTVYDAAGNAVRRIEGENAPGMHRVAWDFHYSEPTLPQPRGEEDEGFNIPNSAVVMPGTYTVRLAQRIRGVTTELGEPQTFEVFADGVNKMPDVDRKALTDFQQKLGKLYGAVQGAAKSADELKAHLREVHEALKLAPGADRSLTESADRLTQQTNDLLRTLRGDNVLRARNENTLASISDRVESVMGDTRFAIVKPTQTDLDAYEVTADEFTTTLAKLHQLVEVDFANLQKQMNAAGAPWTPGAVPNWTK
ncbi:conserved hypothetical protein [Candidatus Koribacter versatilis Ellin345]|uniref:Sortilin N-terminal domain-containing protein n=1 Tax=Koribacter versatilis (strain Ellin345) TaxID=204669 RepID=Q1IUD0_KORVE|nr:glycosyl hydrolase [Candidatus Koribacter versatilis]ABF39520.1 conserved hypothetical protein [Candidatus Koribacter versatilis Ellin345]